MLFTRNLNKKTKPEYDSGIATPPAIKELTELWRYRDLLQLAINNSIKTRYKRSALGVVWTLLNPLLNTVVLTIAFSQILRFPVKDYPIYLLAGLLFWNFFAQTTTHAMNTLIWGSNILKRIYVPRTLFTVSVIGNGLINYSLALIPLALIMLALGHRFSPALLFLPVAVLLTAMFTLGFSLLISTLAVFFVDVVEMFSVLLSAWFYLTPIIYPISIIPEQFLGIVKINPVYYLLELFHSIIYRGEWPPPETILSASVISTLTLLVGWWVFTKKSDEFAYRI